MLSLRCRTGADVVHFRNAYRNYPQARLVSVLGVPIRVRRGFDFRLLSDDAGAESLGDLHLDDWIKVA